MNPFALPVACVPNVHKIMIAVVVMGCRRVVMVNVRNVVPIMIVAAATHIATTMAGVKNANQILNAIPVLHHIVIMGNVRSWNATVIQIALGTMVLVNQITSVTMENVFALRRIPQYLCERPQKESKRSEYPN
jgi:hypothetical protein